MSESQLQMSITTANDPSTWTVKATNPDGKSSSAFSFQVNAPVPVISGISPTSANAGSGAITPTVNGTTFHDGSIVKANGNSLATTPHDSPGGLTTSLTATLPSSYLASAGTVTITVYSPGPGGGTSAGATFTVNGAQTPILSVTPANPPTQPATAGTITLNVGNTGGGTMSYTASVTSGSSWLQISSGASGENSGTIVVSYDQNCTGAQRAGAIVVTANGASGSPMTVAVVQGTPTQGLGADFTTGGGKVEWSDEMSDGRTFVIIKASQDNVNSTPLPNNLTDPHNGVFGLYDFADPYHYYNSSLKTFVQIDPTDSASVIADAQGEANLFYKTAKPYLKVGYLMPSLDLEDLDPKNPDGGGFDSAWTGTPDGWTAMAEWVAAWTTQLQKNLLQDGGPVVTPILYMDQYYASHLSPGMINYFSPSAVNYFLWVADVDYSPNAGPQPTIGLWPQWSIVQYVQTSLAPPPGDLDLLNPNTSIAELEIGVPQNYTVTPSSDSSGNISPSQPQTVPILGTVIFTALPTTSSTPGGSAVPMDITATYVVDEWLVNGIPAQTGGTNFTLLNVTADTTVQVTFMTAPPVAFTVTPSSGGNGVISASDPLLVANGSNVTFTATPYAGYVVDQWLVNNVAQQSGSTSFTLFNVTAPTSVAVIFKAAPVGTYAITVVSAPTYGGTVNGGGAFTAGSRQAVTVGPAPGYSFINWSENGSEVSSSTNYSFTLTTNRTLVANFTATPFMLADKDPPSLLITQPYSSGIFVTTNKTLTLAGTASDLGHGDNGISIVTVNGSAATGDTAANGGTANWSTTTTLKTGANTITVVAKDRFNNASQQQISVTYNPPDLTRPSIAINSPTANQQWSNSTFVVKGKASDNVEVANVFLQLNEDSWTTATTTNGWTNWTASVTVAPGANLLRAYSEDSSGNISRTNTVSFVYIVTSPLTLITNGPGKINRNFTRNVLKVGSTYSVTAAPGRGAVFSNWTGTLTSFANPLTFVMQSNMVLQANIIPSPFAGPHGIYNGLFYTSSGVTEETAGMLRGLNLGPLGTYSATILIGGKSYGISGGFNLYGQTSTNIPRVASQGGSLALEMMLNLGDLPSQITGTVSGTNCGSWVANLVANRATNNGSAEYTVLLSPDAIGLGLPPGYGYVLITNRSGVCTLSGALADGTSLTTASQTVPVSETGDIPVYDSLYGNTGLLLGWVNIAGGSPVGTLEWVKKASHAAALYTNGFTNLLTAQGSLWTNPSPHIAAIDLAAGRLNISGGALLSPLIFDVGVSNNNALVKLPGSPTNSLSGSVNPKTGLLTITFGNGAGKATTTGTGAVLQNTNVAAGFFLGKTNAGSILLQPKN
jgi:hypothetical protein